MKRFAGFRGNRLNIATIVCVAMPGLITVGYNQTQLGGVLSFHSFKKQFPEIDVSHADPGDKKHTSTIQGTIVALYAVGGLLGALSCVWFGDRLGRRRAILGSSAIQIIGAIFMGSAFRLAHLIVARLILGVGTGGLLATVPVWQSEISPTSKRGAHVVTTGVFLGMGLTVALFVDFGMSFAPGSVAWRFPAVFQTVFSLIVMISTLFMPESPRWLVQQGRTAEARATLAALDDTTLESLEIEAEINDVKASFAQTGEQSLLKMFHMGPRRVFHRIMLAAGVMIFLQLAGVNVISLYTTSILHRDLALGDVKSRILAAIYQLISPIGGIVSILTIEGFGRRGLMLASATGNAICMALIGGLGSQPENKLAMHGAVVFTFLFHFSHALGFAGIPFLYATEIAPSNLRTAINGISVGTFWAFTILIAEVTPRALETIGWRYFIIFAGFNVCMIPLIYFLFPETAGRSLEEMDEIFTKSKHVLDPVRVARSLRRRQLEDLPVQKGFCSEKDHSLRRK